MTDEPTQPALDDLTAEFPAVEFRCAPFTELFSCLTGKPHDEPVKVYEVTAVFEGDRISAMDRQPALAAQSVAERIRRIRSALGAPDDTELNKLERDERTDDRLVTECQADLGKTIGGRLLLRTLTETQ